MKRLLIRFDDLNQYMSIDVLKEIKKVCKKYKNSVLLCIIPFCKDENLTLENDLGETFWEAMRYCQKENAVIGLHGFSHRLFKNKKKQLFPISNKSELCGLETNTQYKFLKEGKDLLNQKGLKVRFFAPPAHSMDLNTIEALKEVNIKIVSDSFFSSCTKWKGLIWIPVKTWRENSFFLGTLSTVCKHPKLIKGEYKFTLNLSKNYFLTNFDEEILKISNFDLKEKFLHNLYSFIFTIYRLIKKSRLKNILKIIRV